MIKTIVLGSLFAASTATIRDCDTTSLFRPTTLALNPDPPVPDQSVYLSLIFDNPGSDVVDGTAVTSINVNGIPYSETKALCDATECPLVTGTNNRSTVTVWPSTVTGKVLSTITWKDTSGKSLLCIETSVKVVQTSLISNLWGKVKSVISEQYNENKKEVDSLYKRYREELQNGNLRGL